MVMTGGWFMKLRYTHILMGFWGFTILILIGVTTPSWMVLYSPAPDPIDE